ncbi:hypothetical protein GCM10027155_10250 [Acinetobacter apis]|uniref:Polyisoprenoid-binding protein YceI n=1 Tax=Acinetobacter apis TaxID=1229165 RepID=A0A217EF38_9GAMM|nr:YceI family protein [Acinetobacter apis]SNQ29103.1 Polyisoprenoid-binding protein YceI [Acinetobacter apis]
MLSKTHYRHILFLLTLCLWGISSSFARAETYHLSSDGDVGFYIKKLGLKVVEAEFEQVNSRLVFDEAHLDQTQINFVIQVPSMKTGNSSLQTMMLGEDLFNAQKFKEITFQSTQIQSLGHHQYNIFGNLTIKGKTRPVVFNTSIIPQKEGQNLDFEANTQIESRNFAMKSKFGALTDRVNIYVEGELIPK